MQASLGLAEYSNSIEGAICTFDRETGQKINDDVAIRIYELLLDKYYFKDNIISFDNELVEKGFHLVNQAIEDDLDEASDDNLVRILGVLHYVARRRSQGGREYLQVVNDLVGVRVGSGMRVMSLPRGQH
jgi:hypothetical protein